MKLPSHLRFRSVATLFGTALLSGCAALQYQPLDVQLSAAASTVPTHVAFDLDWKQRLDQPYVYVELLGNYADARRQLSVLAQHAVAQGVRPSGPPFALFYDDPQRVPEAELRSRLCWPVASATAVAGPLGFDVLESEPVVYGFVRGPYRGLEDAYVGFFEYMRERSWVLTGPIREIYHVDPGQVRGSQELVSEIQLPWRPL